MGPSLRKSGLENDRKLEEFSLLWLDASVNATTENLDVQHQLRSLVNHFKTFENTNDCLHYIRNNSKQQQIILIVSGRLGQQIVPRIHRLTQISCIYIYCMNKEKNEKWTQKFSKIKGVIVNLDELVGIIRSDRSRGSFCEQHDEQKFSFNIYKRNSSNEQSIININKQFIHFELLIDCLLKIKSNLLDKKYFISLCREIYHNNPIELSIIDEFEMNYTSDKALWWCINDSFISHLINQSLQTQTFNILYSLRFIFQDVQKQLELNKCSSSIRVYREEFLSNSDIEIFKKSIGDYISINSFLSTNLNYEKTLKNSIDSNVLFEIDADPFLPGIKSFGSITDQNNNEIIFMIGSIFRINEIIHQHDQLLIIRMTLYSDNDSQLKIILKSLKSDENNLLVFGEILCKMGKLIDAEKYYQHLLIELPADDYYHIAECYYGLGNLAIERNNDKLSFEYHQKSLEIKKQILNENNSSIGDSYNSLADIERKKGNSIQALEFYNQALDIWIQAYGNDHPKIGMCLNNIGCIYGEEKNFEKTLEYQEKALKIMEKHFSSDHICLGQAHNNIGSVYRYLGNYEFALEHYQISIEIKSKSFSWKHPSIASTYSNIANVYEEINSFKQALDYYEKAASIYRHRFSPTSQENLRINEDIKRVSNKLKE